MSRPPRIADFVIDDENADKAWRHGIRPGQLLQVLDNRPGIVVNRRNRRGLYKVIGRDDGGACITIPVEPTGNPEVWRPITAWYSEQWEEALL